MVHLAHVTSWGLGELMAADGDDLAFWAAEAVTYWNTVLHPPQDK